MKLEHAVVKLGTDWSDNGNAPLPNDPTMPNYHSRIVLIERVNVMGSFDLNVWWLSDDGESG